MSTTVYAEVRFANVFGDRCVLQREMPLPVWGWAEPGEQLVVTLGEQEQKATAGKDGRWLVRFEPMPAGGPYVLTASGSTTAEVKDVLIGEVWVGIGQSNMMMGLGNTTDGAEALKQLDQYPNLRMSFNFAKIAEKAMADVEPAKWSGPNAGSSATSFYFARRLYEHFKGEVPVGILNYTEIRPAEAWIEESILAASPLAKGLLPPGKGWDATRLYNGVVHPLAPLAFRGVLYYQGEMNGGNSEERFSELLTMVIESWRNAMKRPDLAFLFVQLPGYIDHKGGKDQRMDMDEQSLARAKGGGATHGFVGVRAGFDRVARTVPHTGMAVTIDVGDPWDIHPANKRPVGERLFLQALRVAYGDNETVTSGPRMVSCEVQGARVIVSYETGGAPLELRPGEATGFELAGGDGVSYPAQAKIEGDTVAVSAPQVSAPVMVRYAWAGYSPVALFNTAGLPAAPFQKIDYSKIVIASSVTLPLPPPEMNWRLGEGAQEEGGVISLPKKAAFIDVERFPLTGFVFNSRPVDNPWFVRPGMLLGFSMEVAMSGSDPGEVLSRISFNHNYYDRQIHVANEAFGVRKLVYPIGPKPNTLRGQEYLRIQAMEAKGSTSEAGVKLRNISELTILRPELGYDGPKEVMLTGASALSAPLTIFNAQKKGLASQMQMEQQGEEKELQTVLYGVADGVPSTGVIATTGSVGAILIGPDAASFRLEGDNVTDGGMGVRLMGEDSKEGLNGGTEGERETFAVRFQGGEQPRVYQATLRIVTQAANRGVMSQGNPGEPARNLFYLDIPVRASIGASAGN